MVFYQPVKNQSTPTDSDLRQVAILLLLYDYALFTDKINVMFIPFSKESTI